MTFNRREHNGHSKNALLALGAAAAVVASGQAFALSAKVSGQIDRALMYGNNGDQSKVFNVDNSNSSTRFRFTAEGDVTDTVKAGTVFETEYQSNPSNAVSFDNLTAGSSPTLHERKMEAYFKGLFGKVSIGQGDGAANGNAEVDLSGTSVVSYVHADSVGGGLTFQNNGTDSGISIGDVYNNNDFESRYDRLRYDTPAFGPAVLSASYGDKDNSPVTELAARIGSDVPGGKYMIGLGYSNKDTGSNNPSPASPQADKGNVVTTGGSASYLSNTGLNGTVTYTTKSDDTSSPDAKFWDVKIGYKFGKNAVAIDYGRSKDRFGDGYKADMYRIGYVYKPVGWAELFAAAKVHKLDGPNQSYDDIKVVTTGTRIKF
ncbi:MAG TPA: porin [Gammaproteobacteria bacterium]|nr:porin [Gammaproteobacteria bacterium]